MRDALSGFIDLDPARPEPLHVQLTRQMKSAVLSGRLPPGARLPSSRVMARELGISRNTAVSALEQLKAEGYLESRIGSGTLVAPFAPSLLGSSNGARARAQGFEHRLAKRWERALTLHPLTPTDKPRPFRPGLPDVRAFPYDLWNASLRRAARHLDEASAGYAHFSGHPRFRKILSEHLAETRGIVAEPEQIIVTSSARGGASLIASALLEEGDAVWMEEPGFKGPKAIFEAAGAKLIPVPVDDQGINLAAASALPTPRLIYTTPSHQYPTGALMTLPRRLNLLELAACANAYVVEDDYDSEFQYSGRPIAALQGLDRVGCVLYLGTFSKSLLPSLRVGFIVAPPGLAEKLMQVHRSTSQLVPPIIQLAVADFIESGQYRAHVRRMRTLYAKRLEAFTEAVRSGSKGMLSAVVPLGGMQTVVRSHEDLTDLQLAARLESARIDSHPLQDFHLVPEKAVHHGVVMGFSAWPESEMHGAFARLRPA